MQNLTKIFEGNPWSDWPFFYAVKYDQRDVYSTPIAYIAKFLYANEGLKNAKSNQNIWAQLVRPVVFCPVKFVQKHIFYYPIAFPDVF